MNGKRIGGVVCLILSAGLLMGGVSSLGKGAGPGVNDESGVGVSRAVGAFLPFMVTLILGLWLIKKPESNGASSDEVRTKS